MIFSATGTMVDPPMAPTVRGLVPKTKSGPHLGLCGSNPNSEGTYSTCNPPLFVVSKPRNRPTRRLDPRTSGHLVEPEGCALSGPFLAIFVLFHGHIAEVEGKKGLFAVRK